MDHLVQQGLEGGKKSASLLKAIVQEELKSWDPSVPHHQQIIIRIYANLKGLAKTYTEMGLLPDPRVLEEFVRGFNMRDAMCDFTDAGNGKECTDEKMKGVLIQASATAVSHTKNHKQTSSSAWPTFIVGRYCSALPLTAVMHVYWSLILRTRRSVIGLH